MDHQPTESLGPQEGTIGLVYNFDLFQIQNPFKFQLRTTPSSFPFHPFHTFHFSKIRNLSILPTQYSRREARLVDIGASYGYSPEGCPNHSISRTDPMSHKVWGVVIHFDKLPLTTLTSCIALHSSAQPSTLTLSARRIARLLAPTSKHSLLLFHSRNSSHSPQTHTIQFSSLSPFQPTSLLRDRWKSRLHDAQHVSTFTFVPHPLSAPTSPYLVLQLYTLQ